MIHDARKDGLGNSELGSFHRIHCRSRLFGFAIVVRISCAERSSEQWDLSVVRLYDSADAIKCEVN